MNVDRYDKDVLRTLADLDQDVRIETLYRLYRRAGVRDKWKIRSRIKHLNNENLIQNVENWTWEYTGPDQATLGVSA